jgi:hypothetical protein
MGQSPIDMNVVATKIRALIRRLQKATSRFSRKQFDFDFRKAKIFLRLTKHYAMEVYGGVDVQIHMFSIRFDVFTAVTMKNVVFWDIKLQFVLHRRHITSPLQSPAS